MQEWRTIKVPARAADKVLVLKARVLRLGTAALPEDVRPDGELTMGHIFEVGMARLNELLDKAEKTKNRRKR
jgi:hypothetical protein